MLKTSANKLPDHLIEIYETGVMHDLAEKERRVTGGIAIREAEALSNMVRDVDAKYSAETGVAYGLSTLAMCGAQDKSKTHVHFGVDPCQYTEHGGSAIAALNKAGLQNRFRLLEGPSHLMLPDLIRQNITLDCAFIDGWHTFDYTLVDFFLIDKMLRTGGLLGLHDMDMPSKQKVLKFILTHRDYEVAQEYKICNDKPLYYRLARFAKKSLLSPTALVSNYHWKYQLASTSSLLILRKLSNYEPPYDFFKTF